MHKTWTSVEELAADLKAGMGAGESCQIDAAVWDGLAFDGRRYEARFQALEARLGGGWDVTSDSRHTMIYRRRT